MIGMPCVREKRTGRAAVAVSILTLAPGGLLAQEETQEIEEIVVTASKREESIQDVAMSITAIGAQTLQNFGINDFEDYITLVPGLTSNFAGPVSNRGVRPIGLRGIQTLSNTIVNGQNTVGFYIDNSPIPIANPRLVDLQRIEVLRGPQGTLYGSSSLAGTIKLVTRKPSSDGFFSHFEGTVSSTDEGGNNYDIEGAINIPLSENAALRISGYLENQSGYIDFIDVDATGVPTGATDTDINDMTVTGGRAALRVDLTDSFRIDASAMYSNRELDSQSFYSPDAGGITFAGHFPMPAYDEFWLGSIGFQWDLSAVQIVSTTSYFDSDSDFFNDQTDVFGALLFPPPIVEVPYNPYGNKNEEITHETRILSAHDGPFQYVAGIFITRREEVSSTTLPAPEGKDSILGIFPWPPGGPIFMNTSPRERDETAVFGEASYELNDEWRIVAGLRYFSFDFTTMDDLTGSTLLVPDMAQVLAGQAEEDGMVPKLVVEYRPTENRLFYASTAEGFRMGGANFPIPTNVPSCAEEVEQIFGEPVVPSSFDSDSLTSYEVGTKTTWGGGRLVFNAAGFFIDWSDPQIPTGTLCNFSGAVLNAGKVESRGAEVELQGAVTPDLRLAVSASFMDTEIAEDFRLPGATAPPFAVAGDPLPDIPKWTAAVMGQYSFPAFRGWEGFVRGDYRYQDGRTANIAGTSFKESFAEANLRIGLTDQVWRVTLFVDNISNERPSLQGVPSTASLAGFGLDNTLRPRTFGLSIRRDFGGYQ